MSVVISWDPKTGLMTVQTRVGFTQLPMTEKQARGLALVIGADFYVSEPGTTVRPRELIP